MGFLFLVGAEVKKGGIPDLIVFQMLERNIVEPLEFFEEIGVEREEDGCSV